MVWGLAAHTVAMFSFVTIYTATNLDMLSIPFIDNREFPGIGNAGIPPGPVGYQLFIIPGALDMVTKSMIVLNTWLVDGLLVSSMLICVSNTQRELPPSFTVVTLFIPGIPWSLPFPS